jgi:hypothetical protein
VADLLDPDWLAEIEIVAVAETAIVPADRVKNPGLSPGISHDL